MGRDISILRRYHKVSGICLANLKSFFRDRIEFHQNICKTGHTSRMNPIELDTNIETVEKQMIPVISQTKWNVIDVSLRWIMFGLEKGKTKIFRY